MPLGLRRQVTLDKAGDVDIGGQDTIRGYVEELIAALGTGGDVAQGCDLAPATGTEVVEVGQDVGLGLRRGRAGDNLDPVEGQGVQAPIDFTFHIWLIFEDD